MDKALFKKERGKKALEINQDVGVSISLIIKF